MIEDDDDSLQDQDDAVVTRQASLQSVDSDGKENLSRSSSKGDDEMSTGSDVFGEKLSDKDRQAVLARLRLAQPDAATNSPTDTAGAPLRRQTPEDAVNCANGRKGILKRSNTQIKNSNKALESLASSKLSSGTLNGDLVGNKRRSLFPLYETKTPSEKKHLQPNFAPMARVVTIKSHKEMDEHEKSRIWWQKPDYEEFRRTGRMITRAMLEGGSEIWLATNQSWQMPNQGKAQTLQHAYSLAERQAAVEKGDLKAKYDYEDTRDKWWHKFGHSRRGLEHIASIDEGRQRQMNVKTSIRSVLEEQRRQKAFNREDPEKLRMVSIQNTTWAKDLSLASGASDADAVQKNFDDESRKSREFYLLKFSRANQSSNVPNAAKKVMPAFMKPMLTMQIAPNRLDAHTTSQIRFRQTQQIPSKVQLPGSSTNFPIRNEDDSRGPSMAKKAAGFASGEEVANMSAVLTGMGGMGPSLKNTAATVGGP